MAETDLRRSAAPEGPEPSVPEDGVIDLTVLEAEDGQRADGSTGAHEAAPPDGAGPPGDTGSTGSTGTGGTGGQHGGSEHGGRTPPWISAAFDRGQAAMALRALPYGGTDDASLGLRLPPPVQATVSPVIAAVRWGAVMFGMVSAVTRANKGNLEVVIALAVVLFLTTWRTLRPIRLGAPQRLRRLVPVADAILVGLAAGWSGNITSPFVFCVLACAVVAAFGWGLLAGSATAVAGLAGMGVAALASNDEFNPFSGQGPGLLATFALVVSMVAFARSRLLDAETRRATLAGQIDLLAETNDLLHILNELARTLPQSLDLREALAATRAELRRTFNADVIALVTLDDHSNEWIPQIADGCALRPSVTGAQLPVQLRRAAEQAEPLLHGRFAPGSGLGARSASGLYVSVRARDRTIGVLGVEHRNPGQYSARHARLMAGLSDVLALTVDNARSFSRLRTLGADEERSRIARDLHDRLGQWLSYINFELERIIDTSEARSDELDRLHRDVQTAIDELRETLRQLRAEVTEERSFALVAADLIDRFNARAGAEGGPVAHLDVVRPGRRLAVRTETELLRILQEALSNVAKHAQASAVKVRWDVLDGAATLTIHDDGRGFTPDKGIRDSAYGLVGMRERADVIGARILVRSSPGQGTTITVRAGRAGRSREEGNL
ncbi:MAG: ATP-binding protein [Acidimicrobiia bacterium]